MFDLILFLLTLICALPVGLNTVRMIQHATTTLANLRLESVLS
jgi:hypothetical protein